MQTSRWWLRRYESSLRGALARRHVAGEDVDEKTAAKLRRAVNRAVAWAAENEDRSRDELLRDLKPELRKDGLLPELTRVRGYQQAEFQERSDWMLDRGFLDAAPKYEETVRSK